MTVRISRRGVLSAAAALGAAALVPRGVARADSTPPKRLLVVFSANGTIYDKWVPTGSETSFTLPTILAPLAPFQRKLVVLDGIDAKSARNGPGDDHMRGMGHMLTGTELLSGTTQGGAGTPAGFAGGISIDQRIVKDVGTTTRFPSLELGVFVSSSDVWSRMIYAGANQPLPPMEDPVKVYARLFASAQQSSADLAKLMKRRQSVLDHVQATLTSLGGKVSADDRVRLQQHQESVREIERQLLAQAAACTAPAAPMSLALDDETNYPAVGRLQMDMLVTALACDQTRVASLQWSHSVSQIGFPWLGISQGHHDLSHKDDTDTASQDALVQINTWYAEQLAYLLGKLDAVTEPDGTTLLDNTLVVWMNELAKGNIHSHAPLPVVLAGGCQRAIRTGRYVKLATPQPHNDLLVSIANAMGVPLTTFGNPAYCTGPLSGLA